jgi:hypothetical protein
MIFDSIIFSPNCKKITVTMSEVTGNVSFNYENRVSGVIHDSPVPLVPEDNKVIWERTIIDLGETNPINGVIVIRATDDDGNVTSAVVSSCELSCCIAKLVEAGITCSCNCSQCDDDIRTAEKIHLLIKSSEAAANQGNIDDAIDKYNKAKEYCTTTCGCNC